MNKKLAVFDYDGTLKQLTEDRIPQETATFLSSLRDKGIVIIIATGRPHEHCQYLLEENLADCIISANGALAKTHDSIITETAIDSQQLSKLKNICHKNHIPLTLFTDKMIHNNIINDDLLIGLQESMTIAPSDLSNNIDNEMKGKNAYLACVYIKGDHSHLQAAIPTMHFLRWHERIVSCLSKPIDKIDGLKQVLKYYNVHPNEIVSFGDGNNDIEVAKLAGISVAMDHGSTRLKNNANIIVSTIDKNLEHLFYT